MTPTVSVALCTHNGRDFLAQQLRSILEQSHPIDELVLSDDASTDGTPELAIELWPQNGPRLLVLRNATPLGVTANFEQALAACEGDLILLSDQDDVWVPDRVARSLEAFDRDPRLLLLFTDADLVDGSGAPLNATLWESLEIARNDLDDIRRGHAFRALLRRNLATGATMTLRRGLLEVARPFPASWVHDEWLAILAATQNAIDWDERPSISYRQHAGNQIGAAKPTLRRKIRRVIEPRGTRNAVLAARAAALVDRLQRGDVPDVLAVAQGKAAHEAARAALPAARLRRIAPVLRALRRGDYDRYSSRRNLDVIRDLLQPER